MRLPKVYTFEDARKIHKEICEEILKWGMFSVVDMYEFIADGDPRSELPSVTYKDTTIGWDSYDISSIIILDFVGGSVIDLPEPHTLDLEL